MSHSWSIYTSEISKHYKSGPRPTQELIVKHLQAHS